MGLVSGMLSVLGIPFFPYISSFYSGVLVLGVWVCLMGVGDHLWSGDFISMGSWSQSLIVMSVVLTVVGSVSCVPSFQKKSYNYCMLLVGSFSILAFVTEGGMVFFLLFEMTFFPISFLILMWGYNQERVVAVVYMAVYSFIGSVLHIVSLAFLAESGGITYFSGVSLMSGFSCLSMDLWFNMLFLLFLVKCPLFGWHLWLSKAHVEAPTGASMSLAAILLKLGIYGVVGYGGLFSGGGYDDLLTQIVGVLGSIYASVVCLRSQNIKLIIAQSSVAHMSLCVAAYFCDSEGSVNMVCMMAVIHGFCAAGMFCWAGRHYNLGSSQNMMLASGQRLLYLDGVVAMGLFLICNSGIPPFISFWVELVFFTSLYSVWSGGVVVFILSSVMCLFFNIVFGLNVFHGRTEASQGKHGCCPCVEAVGWGLMVAVLAIGYLC